MSIFKNLSTTGLEKSEDRMGGFSVHPTDSYDAVIKMAYADTWGSGAQFIHFEFQLPGGKLYSEDVTITNKKGENWFPNKDDPSKKVPLPGFTIVDDICLCATEKPLEEQDTEEKQVKIYDRDEKKEVAKARHVLVDLIGQPVTLGIRESVENKTEKMGDDYVPTADEIKRNNIEKVFHTETKLTMVEVREEHEATFHKKWVELNKGKVADKRKFGKGANAQKTGGIGKAAPSANASAEPTKTKSLFGKKS